MVLGCMRLPGLPRGWAVCFAGLLLPIPAGVCVCVRRGREKWGLAPSPRPPGSKLFPQPQVALQGPTHLLGRDAGKGGDHLPLPAAPEMNRRFGEVTWAPE